MSAQHPLAVLGHRGRAVYSQWPSVSELPEYDPLTQLQGNWDGVANHLEILSFSTQSSGGTQHQIPHYHFRTARGESR